MYKVYPCMYAFSETFGNELQFPVPSVLTHFSVHFLKTDILFSNCSKILKSEKLTLMTLITITPNTNSPPSHNYGR